MYGLFYLVEHLFIQIDVRCFVSKESKSGLIYMFMNHLFDTISEEVGHGPKRLMEVKIDQSETRKLR